MFGNIRKAMLLGSVMLVALLFLAACSDEDSTAPTTTPDPTPAGSISAPSVAMALPASMTAATPATATLSVAQANGDPNCDFGNESNPFENGYTLTKFLVSLSQGQTCFADFIIEQITTNALPFVGVGLVPTGDTTAGEPTHFQIEQSTDGNTYQVWLFFDGTGTTPSVYATWTTATGGDLSGQLIFTETSGTGGEPDAVRVDFSRSATSDTNKIYIRFPNTGTHNMEGFRVEVTRTGTSPDSQYVARGRMSMLGQWGGNNLPTTETFVTPSLSMVAVANEAGLGAAIASFDNVAIHMASVDTDLSDGDQSFSFGSYQYTVSDKAYFLADGTEEWINKGSISGATYVNTSGSNVRSDSTGGVQVGVLVNCLEDTDCTAFGLPDMQLGTDYFTSTCYDTQADPPTADCTTFVQGIYDWGFLNTPNSTGPEPSGDFRQAFLAAAVQLTSVWPTGENATTTFAIPAAP
jgi:hypothetical protein